MLRGEGVQFQVRKNPDLKCAVVERVHRTIRDRLYKYFTYKYTYRYIDVLTKFVRAYKYTVHSTVMALSRVIDSDVLAIWKRMEARRRRVSVAKATFRVVKQCASARSRCGLPRLPNGISAPRYFGSRK